jgi:hypothetical protein
MNECITKVELCELQSDLFEYWILSVWLWVDCSLSVSIPIACAALLVDATPGSLATADVSALRGSALFARALSCSCIWASLLDLWFFLNFLVFCFL